MRVPQRTEAFGSASRALILGLAGAAFAAFPMARVAHASESTGESEFAFESASDPDSAASASASEGANAREVVSVVFGRPALSGDGCDSFNAFSRVASDGVRITFSRFFAPSGASVRCGAIIPLEVRGGIVRFEVRRTLSWSGFSGGQRPARIQSVGDFGGRALESWILQPFLGGQDRDSKREVVEVSACASNGYRGSARLDTRVAAPVSPGASIELDSLRLTARVLSVSRCD